MRNWPDWKVALAALFAGWGAILGGAVVGQWVTSRPVAPPGRAALVALPDLLAGCEGRVTEACLDHLHRPCPERAASHCAKWRAAAAARGQ